MPRPIWKGSISFGLVNIPVTLYSAEKRAEIKFRMLDSRNLSRVRYERVNEATGDEVPWNAIVKGYEYSDGQYVLLSEEEMANASAEATKTVDIEDFIDLDQVDYIFFDKPYYLESGKGAEKSYALLVEAMKASGKVGIARVVIRSKQHLCALLVREGRLVMEILRFDHEIRDISEVKAPDRSLKRNQVAQREKDMAMKLIDSMSVDWDPSRYRDEHQEKLMEWIQKKIDEGQFEASVEHEDDEGAPDSNVVDLVDYLKRSVAKRSGDADDDADEDSENSKGKSTRKSAKKKTSAKAKKKTATKKSARKTAAKSKPKAKAEPKKKARKAS